jgi:hypothetical protein
VSISQLSGTDLTSSEQLCLWFKGELGSSPRGYAHWKIPVTVHIIFRSGGEFSLIKWGRDLKDRAVRINVDRILVRKETLLLRANRKLPYLYTVQI